MSAIKYSQLILETEENLLKIQEELSLIPKEDSWVYIALAKVKHLEKNLENPAVIEKEKETDELYLEKYNSSLSQLLELNSIISSRTLIPTTSRLIFKKKLKTILNSPLLLLEEDYNNSEGRNTLFEIKLYLRFLQRGYEAYLSFDHPDILIKLPHREYAIECKRIYQPGTLIANAKDAVDQLLTYSLKDKKRLGIVAISITRYFHDGNLFLQAKNEVSAKQRINYEMTQVLQNNRNQLLSIFPLRIPALILEFSDRGYIDKPYLFSFIDIIETANGKLSIFDLVRKDFSLLEV